MANAADYLELILKQIHDIRTITEDGNPFKTIAFNKAKCKYLTQELTTSIQPKIETSLMPAVAGDTVGPVLGHIAFAVQNAARLVSRSCERKWWTEIFWKGDGTEAFGDVLIDLQAAMDIAIDNASSTDRSISRCRSELGQAWNSMVLQDRSFVMCNVRLMVQHKADPATGKSLQIKDLEIAKHVLERDHPDNVIQLGMVRVVKRIVKGITCIRWHGKECVMKRFPIDECAKAEASIMKDLMHPNVVLLIGYARRKNRLNLFSQPSPNILLEYAEQGDLCNYIQNLQKDLEPDVIVNVMLEIAKGMHYIHSKKIAHLDLKSKNVYVTYHTTWDLRAANFFHVKIGDFGNAIRCDHDRPIPDWIYGQGTHRWRAPELFKEASRCSYLDLLKADVYSYAMVCVELVTRQLPLHDKFPDFPTSSKVYEYISEANSRPSLPSDSPPEVLSIIRRCWDGEPSKRPSFEKIVEALECLKREMLLDGQFYSAAPKDIFKNYFRDDVVAQAGMNMEMNESLDLLIFGRKFTLDFGEDDELVKKATMSPLSVIQTIHPPSNAQECEMLIQLGGDVRSNINKFVDGGAMIGQHMYTARASHLQPILGEFQAQLHLLHVDANNLNVTLFNEVFNVLKKVEFLLESCSWPAIGFQGGPTATDEGFLSLRKDLQHCVHSIACR
jgi:serine/threonine protein kinase